MYARDKARKWRSLVKQGIDPAAEEERERQVALRKQATTFGSVVEDFIREKLPALKAATELADFQSPRFAPANAPPPPLDPRGPIKKKFTINIFDYQGRPAPRHIDVSQTKRSKEPTCSSD